MFTLRWEWKMPAGYQQCQFLTDVIPNTNQKTKTQHMFRTLDVHKVDLNNQITFKVEAECNGTKIKPAESHVLLIPGNKVYVKNFACIYFDEDYMNCTWEPVVDSVPATDYVLHYWDKQNSTASEGIINPSAKFDQLLNSGTPCQHYIYKDDIPLGCHFKTLSVTSLFLMVIRDKSNTIRPFVASVTPDEVVKLSPPVIINTTRVPNHSIFVQWTTTFKPSCSYIDSEVEITNSKDKEEKKELLNDCTYAREFNAIPELTYKVRVRVKLSAKISPSLLWSEWSEVHEIKGTGDRNITFYLLLILIPISVSIVTIIILIYLKRLKIIVFPPIPDPGKVFKKIYGDPSELQQWMKYGKVNVSSKPAKEEICSVTLVETPLFSSQAE
ncbi:interleukin-13 receptor subunit alpha-1 isoform X2 [Xenopus laevis]|nr:interleukin-13 receptor subunit alpha-1 isoform X2 [Xenopus laevis]